MSMLNTGVCDFLRSSLSISYLYGIIDTGNQFLPYPNDSILCINVFLV